MSSPNNGTAVPVSVPVPIPMALSPKDHEKQTQTQKHAPHPYKGFVAGVFSGATKLIGTSSRRSEDQSALKLASI